MKKKKELNKKTWIITKLRRISLMWPPRSEAFKLARISRGIYQCAGCKGEFKRQELKADHINPVVDVKYGFEDWEVFIESLFCDVDGYQCLCGPCHDKKTEKEQKKRTILRKKRKKS